MDRPLKKIQLGVPTNISVFNESEDGHTESKPEQLTPKRNVMWARSGFTEDNTKPKSEMQISPNSSNKS